MFHVIQEPGCWIIVKKYGAHGADHVVGSVLPKGEQNRADFDGFWTGDRWAQARDAALRFETNEQAVRYLANNESQM
jgi:hypothetical protein